MDGTSGAWRFWLRGSSGSPNGLGGGWWATAGGGAGVGADAPGTLMMLTAGFDGFCGSWLYLRA